MNNIPESILAAIEQVIEYAANELEWVTVKKELLRCLHPKDRQLFSTRDHVTKRQSLNELEKKIVSAWQDLCGHELLVR